MQILSDSYTAKSDISNFLKAPNDNDMWVEYWYGFESAYLSMNDAGVSSKHGQ